MTAPSNAVVVAQPTCHLQAWTTVTFSCEDLDQLRRAVVTSWRAAAHLDWALELSLHAHDVCAGLGAPFEPATELYERLRQHTVSWPMWQTLAGWGPLTMRDEPWSDLLLASGRRPLQHS